VRERWGESGPRKEGGKKKRWKKGKTGRSGEEIPR
jgi:hypothetical protein